MDLKDEVLKVAIWGALAMFALTIILILIYILLPSLIGPNVRAGGNGTSALDFADFINNVLYILRICIMSIIVLGLALITIAALTEIIEINKLKLPNSTKVLWILALIIIPVVSLITPFVYYFKFRIEYLKRKY